MYVVEFDFIASNRPSQMMTATEKSLKALLRRLCGEYPIVEYSATDAEEYYLFSTPRGLLALTVSPKPD